MRYARVGIMKGLWYGVGGYWPEDPGLDYQLYNEMGEPVKGDFHGEAAISDGDDGYTYITTDLRAHAVNIMQYRVDRMPTKDSVEYRAGWLHAWKQKRRVRPSESKPQRFHDGWRDAWEEKSKARPNPGMLEFASYNHSPPFYMLIWIPPNAEWSSEWRKSDGWLMHYDERDGWFFTEGLWIRKEKTTDIEHARERGDEMKVEFLPDGTPFADGSSLRGQIVLQQMVERVRELVEERGAKSYRRRTERQNPRKRRR